MSGIGQQMLVELRRMREALEGSQPLERVMHFNSGVGDKRTSSTAPQRASVLRPYRS
jgi:hypothetical protein